MASSSSINWGKKLNGIPKFSILQIADYIKENGKNRAFERGYNFFIESYIHDAFACKTDNKFHLKAKCWRSQRKNESPHVLSAEICLNGSKVLGGQCSCIAGTGGVCNHIIALLYTVNHWVHKKMTEIPADMSCTEVGQAWHKPRGDKIEPEPVMKLTFAKATTDRQLRKREAVKCYLYDGRAKKSKGTLVPSKDELSTVQKVIGARNSNIPIVYLTEDHSMAQTSDTLFGEVPAGSPLSYQLQDYHSSALEFSGYIPSKVDIVLQEILHFPDIPIPQSNLSIDTTHIAETTTQFLESLNITKSKAEEIEQSTVDQSQNHLWHEMRKHRLTASRFGDVINRKSVPSQAFLNNLFTSKDLSRVASISHGRDKEDIARKLYTKKIKKSCHHDVIVFRTGLLINPCCAYLGASPDGKIIDRSSYDHFGLLEIKCPYKYRNATLTEAARNTDFCLEIINGEMHLKKTHNYYYQVTGQMAIAGVNWCDFVVFTNKGLFVERICFDKNVWAAIFPKLAQFYINSAVPYLANS